MGQLTTGVMVQGYEALTEKEKQTLRLLLVGHDAKSLARHFGLSVHTINERLRDARRKLSVSSSKEAARLLREAEGATPELIGTTPFGDVPPASLAQHLPQPPMVPRSRRLTAWAIGGIAMMSLVAALLALSGPVQAPADPVSATTSTVAETAVTKAARDWLKLVDNAQWRESWAGTSHSFQTLNTVEVWQSTSEKVRAPLGRIVSRTLVSEQDTPAPPNGLKVVRFRTDFANRRGVTETVSLDREGGEWKVVGIYVD
ncbi:helix-turn-helix domain-containing protein [Sphingomonas jeddahensis]|uniref:helix-turn-helix domain-containing protein n=1 Tax=Sphingomonas jeddahensis TaxID=1915074 RepID=UPI001E2C33CD|nr:DUF4019 domain-containing protein [Sphingomonas jeddahensis]